MDWQPVQARLGVTVDGDAGPKTWAALLACVAGRALGPRGEGLAAGCVKHLPLHGIDTPLRIAHFLGQTAHESGRFQFLREIWGPTLAQRGYEGRGDLGNTQPGDGHRFLGRGLIQLTGRSNYALVGKRVGLDLMADPALAERPDIAVLTAADWWAAHGCNALADSDAGLALGRLINRGSAKATRPANGEAERVTLTSLAKRVLGA